MLTCTLRFKPSCLFILLLVISCSLSAQKINTITAVEYPVGNIRPIYGLAVDQKNNILIAQSIAQDILKLSVNNLTIIAGQPYEPGYSGDNALATNANLNYPATVAVDKQNNVYTYGQIIRKIGQDGKITTYLGENGYGFSGDGGPVSKAKISYATAMAFDSKGNIYIADAGNARIRKIDVNGIITTVAGDGLSTYNGENIPALQAQFTISGLTCDKYDQIYFTDPNNSRVRKIDSNGIVTTVAGNGFGSNSCTLVTNDTSSALKTAVGSPGDVRVDENNNVFFETNGCSVLYVDKTGKIHSAFGESDLGAIDYKSGFIYFSSTDEDICLFQLPSIYKYDIKTHKISDVYFQYFTSAQLSASRNLFAGTYQPYSPKGVYFYNNNILISNSYQVRKIDNAGVIQVIAGDGIQGYNGYGDGGNALNARFGDPQGLARDNNGNIFIADHSDGRIRKIDKNNIISTFAMISTPYDLETDADGNLFVSSDYSGIIYKLNSKGQSRVYAKGLGDPEGIAFDKHGNLFVADYGSNTVKKIDSSGHVKLFAGIYGNGGFSGDGGLATEATLNYPSGVGVDDNGNVFIADEQNNRIRKVDSAGIITTVAGGGLGEYYRCDGDHLTYGSYSGDDDIATKANLNYPEDITLNAKGNVIFVDSYNSMIREIEFNENKKPLTFSYGITTYVNRQMELNYDDNLLCKITPQGNYLNAVNDVLTSNVWLEKTVITDSTKKPFASRHYQVYPWQDSGYSGNSILTLYFTQTEFNGYNNKATGYLKLPASANDQNGIHNLRVYAYNSKSKDSSGLPRSYASALITINPADGNIVWNADNGYWEVSFNTNLFGGFFVGTESSSLTAKKETAIQTEDQSINIYPNPATDNIYVSLPATLLYKPVQLISINGKMISEQIAKAQTINFNIKDVASGIYLIRFADGEVKKVIISKK